MLLHHRLLDGAVMAQTVLRHHHRCAKGKGDGATSCAITFSLVAHRWHNGHAIGHETSNEEQSLERLTTDGGGLQKKWIFLAPRPRSVTFSVSNACLNF
jgi:hypothetical protein